MRTISLRAFRDSIADQTEPVIVQRRDKAGNYQVIGEWRPLFVRQRVEQEARGEAPVLGFVDSDPNQPLDRKPMRNVPVPGGALHQEPWSRFHPVPKPTRRK